MLELIGANTRRPIRPAVAMRILDNLDANQVRFLDRKPGRLGMHAAGAAAAIDKARESYRCRDARKELRAMREDATIALQQAVGQSLTIVGPEEEVGALYIHLQQSLLKGS